ncbi:MAG TPA: hypothetical protein VFG87_06730 [Amycolatopsis sp.]|jgi:hypothetical protein|nr:hypothetical protein [Amycolatopsis sp.]
MSRVTEYLFALATGVSVNTVHLPQPPLRLLVPDLHVDVDSAGTRATLVRLGYAFGILFLVPLADRLRPPAARDRPVAADGKRDFRGNPTDHQCLPVGNRSRA